MLLRGEARVAMALGLSSDFAYTDVAPIDEVHVADLPRAREWLRDKLGYRGLIVSDCDAVGDAWRSHKYCDSAANATALGIKHGCDQDCGSTYKAANLQSALSAGLLAESDVDVALGRIMTMRFNLGMFDGSAVPYTRIPIETTMNSAAGQKAALAAAHEVDVALH